MSKQYVCTVSPTSDYVGRTTKECKIPSQCARSRETINSFTRLAELIRAANLRERILSQNRWSILERPSGLKVV